MHFCTSLLEYEFSVWKMMLLSQFLLQEVGHTGLSSAEDSTAVQTNSSAFVQ